MSGFGKMLSVKKGSVLVEALLAVVIFSVGVTLVIRSMGASLKVSLQSPDHTTALLLLENEMTRLMREKTVSSGFSEQRYFPAPYDRYSCSLTARPASGEGLDNVNEVTAGISWRSGQKIHKIILKTLLLNAS